MTDWPTLRWFGEDWGAPVCDPELHTDTPIGEPCGRCPRRFDENDEGVSVPYINPIAREIARVGEAYATWPLDHLDYLHFHRACFMEAIGARG